MSERLCLPVAAWPLQDQQLWAKGLARLHSPFRAHGGGRSRSPFTDRKMAAGYGRWISFLQSRGLLDHATPPDRRVTPGLLDDYLETLRAHGNSNVTIRNRFHDLAGALEVMLPHSDHGWITRPGGASLNLILPVQRRDRALHLTSELLDWALDVFRAGLAHRQPRCRKTLVRTAAIIGVLAMPAPRLRTLSLLRLGRHLRRGENLWFLDIEGWMTKTGYAEACPLLPEVTPILDRYVEVERRELLAGQLHDHAWIGLGGQALTPDGIVASLRAQSVSRFGHRVGPHAFRRGLATMVGLEGYASPLDASVLLGHRNPQTTITHYNLATSAAASRRHADRLRQLRREAGSGQQ